MNSLPRFACALAIAAGAGSTACDSLATQEYKGEPLFVLKGVVRSRLDVQPDNFQLGLVFTGPSAVPGGMLLAHVPAEVEGDFPARFTLRLLEPPPAELLDDAGSTDGTLVIANSLPQGIIEIGPQADMLALADELGWIDVAPVGVTYFPELEEGQASTGNGFVLKQGFNAWTYDVDAAIASNDYNDCVDDWSGSGQAEQCLTPCGDIQQATDEDVYVACVDACRAAACGELPEGTFGYLEPGTEVSFELGHSLLSHARARRAAGN